MRVFKVFFVLIGFMGWIHPLKADHLYGGEFAYKVVDSANGIYQVSLFLERPCDKSQMPVSLSINMKTNTGNSTTVFNYYQSTYTTSPCFGNDACQNPLSKNLERREYRNIINLGKNNGWVAFSYKGLNRAYSSTIAQAEAPLFLHLVINTNITNNSVLFTPALPYFPMANEIISERWIKNDMENDSTTAIVTASYSDTTSSIFYPQKLPLSLGLSNNKPIKIIDSPLVYSQNLLTYTPTEAHDGWINTLVKEYRTLKINNKDTVILLCQYNKDRYVSIKEYNPDIVLLDITSPKPNVIHNGLQMSTVCNDLDTVQILYKFKVYKGITGYQESILGSQWINNSNYTKTTLTSATSSFDTLIYTFKFKAPNTDTIFPVFFQTNYCKLGSMSLTRQFRHDIRIFNYKFFNKDTLLSCNSNVSIELINPKSATFNIGTRSNMNLNIPNPTDTFIYSWVQNPIALCPNKDSIYLNQGSIFSTQVLTKAVSCFDFSDGTAKVLATGSNSPFTYKWTNLSSSDSITGLRKGLYKVSTFDKDKCEKIDSFAITEPDGIKAIWTMSKPISCYGYNDGSGFFTINGNLYPNAYHWNHTTLQDSFLNLLSANTYSGHFSYTNTLGATCNQPFVLNISQPNLLTFNALTIDNKCSGDSNGIIALVPYGGNSVYTYHLDTTANYYSLKSRLPNGTYSVKVTDQKGCQSSVKSVQITSPNPMIFSFNIVHPSCNEVKNGIISVNSMSGGVSPYEYSLNNASFVENESFTNLEKGIHTLKIRDFNGCQIDTHLTLIPKYKITGSVIAINDLKCNNDSKGLIAMNMTSAISPLNISHNNELTTSNFSTLYLDNLKSGSHIISLKDKNNCPWDTTVILNEPNPFKINKVTKIPTCYESENGNIILNITGNTPPYNNITWNQIPSNSTSIYNIKGGSYIITLEDARGCKLADTTLLPYGAKLNATLTVQKEISCYNYHDGLISAVVLGGTEPIEYQWNQYPFSPIASFSQAIAGWNYLKVRDKNGCTTEGQIELKTPLLFEIDYLKLKNPDCPEKSNGLIQISAKGGNVTTSHPYLYSIDNGNSYSTQSIFSQLSAKRYSIVAKDSNQCLAKIDTSLTTQNELNVSFLDPTISLKTGTSVTLNPLLSYGANTNLNSITKINWTPNFGLSCKDCLNPTASPFSTKEYDLELIYGQNCVVSSKIKLIVEGTNEVFIPNSFSPNGDGHNDEWYVYGNHVSRIDCQVFDYLGQLVHRADDVKKSWNGTYKGKESSIGLYSYKIFVEYIDGTNKMYQGSVLLTR